MAYEVIDYIHKFDMQVLPANGGDHRTRLGNIPGFDGVETSMGSMVRESVERRMSQAVAVQRQELRRGLVSLAAISYSATLVGFLGGCLGIMNAFRGCIGERSACVAALASGIADGLTPMLWGLAVAIPVFWAHRFLSGLVEQMTLEMTVVAAEFCREAGTSLHDH